MNSLWWSHERIVLDWREGKTMGPPNGAHQATADYLLAVPLERTLSFDVRPKEGASSRLARVIEDNLPVWTPFRPEEVWLQPAQKQQPGNNPIEIIYVPRLLLKPAIEGAKVAGLRIDGLIFEGREGPPLLFDRQAAFRRRLVRHGEKIGSVLFMVLAILAGLSGLDRLERMENQYKTETAKSLRTLRAIEAPGNRTFGALAQVKRHPPASSVLAEILAKMSNHTVIVELEWKPDEVNVRLQKEAAEAFRETVQPGEDWRASETALSGQGLATIQYRRERLP
jgi:hypothetical protein